MNNKDIINWRALSTKLTDNPENVRSNKIPKRFKEAIKELDDLIEYWKNRNGIFDKPKK